MNSKGYLMLDKHHSIKHTGDRRLIDAMRHACFSGPSAPSPEGAMGREDQMRRSFALVVSMSAVAVLLVAFAAPAGAYGGGAGHDTWQIGVSFNCNNPSACGNELGGFWGWAEFDRSVDGTQTWGDAEFAGCGHTVGGGGPGSAGAGHISVESERWTIAPGDAGPMTFFASGEETDFFRNSKVATDFTDLDTGFPAVPGHYSTDEIFGFPAPPGVAAQIQVAFRPAR